MRAKLNRDLATKVVVAAVAGIGLVMYWQVLSRPRGTRHPGDGSCISSIKQLGTSGAIYCADSDGVFPPYFTFESIQARDSFVKCLSPYVKDSKILACPQDLTPKEVLMYKNGMEGSPGKMSFVHPQSLKGFIPSYSTGNRSLREADIEFPAKTSFLRDPIRGYGEDNKPGDLFTGPLSPHGRMFFVSHFDTSAKGIRLNINSDL